MSLVGIALNLSNHTIFVVAWYDLELTGYQKERQDCELEKTFEEREKYLREKGIELPSEGLRPKDIKTEQPEWQKTVKTRKRQDFYKQLEGIEQDQVLKEQRMREQSHQYAIPGDRVSQTTTAKDMASKYEESLYVFI